MQAQRRARDEKDAAWRAALRTQELKRLAKEQEEELANKAADQARAFVCLFICLFSKISFCWLRSMPSDCVWLAASLRLCREYVRCLHACVCRQGRGLTRSIDVYIMLCMCGNALQETWQTTSAGAVQEGAGVPGKGEGS